MSTRRIVAVQVSALLISAFLASCSLIADPESDGPPGPAIDPGAPSAARVYLVADPPSLDVPVEIGLQLAVSDDPAPTYAFAADDLIRVIVDVMPGDYRVSVDGAWCAGSVPLPSSRETDVRLDLEADGCTVRFGAAHAIGDEHTLD
jgi:hypothetical protein